MSGNYVRAKVKEALEATGEDRKEAKKLLMTWIVRDHPLLLGFVKPHLKDIVDDRLDDEFKKLKKDKGSDTAKVRTLGDKRSPQAPLRKAKATPKTLSQKIKSAFKKK